MHHFPLSYKLDDTLVLLKKGGCVHWVSEGDWSMHELMIGILAMTGPAEVYISSYAFMDLPARLIADLVEKKIIKKLYCIIDKRIDVRSASALNIIRNVATRVELVNTHAKVTVVEGKKMMAVVICSSNYTQNRRYECGVIVTDRDAVTFHKNWIRYVLDNR